MIVGIDPDVDRSGVAVAINGKITELHNYDFWQLYGWLMSEPIDKVYIEAGWLNKTKNYHGAKNKAIAAKIGADVGANHQMGKLIEKSCKDIKIDYELIKPTQAKIKDQKLFNKLTGWEGRTNQEQRDAAMLILGRIK